MFMFNFLFRQHFLAACACSLTCSLDTNNEDAEWTYSMDRQCVDMKIKHGHAARMYSLDMQHRQAAHRYLALRYGH
jgi:hypothetical protein